MKNQQIIGTATDCLSSITQSPPSVALVGTTYFNLPSGTLITRGNTTVAEILHDYNNTERVNDDAHYRCCWRPNHFRLYIRY